MQLEPTGREPNRGGQSYKDAFDAEAGRIEAQKMFGQPQTMRHEVTGPDGHSVPLRGTGGWFLSDGARLKTLAIIGAIVLGALAIWRFTDPRGKAATDSLLNQANQAKEDAIEKATGGGNDDTSGGSDQSGDNNSGGGNSAGNSGGGSGDSGNAATDKQKEVAAKFRGLDPDKMSDEQVKETLGLPPDAPATPEQMSQTRKAIKAAQKAAGGLIKGGAGAGMLKNIVPDQGNATDPQRQTEGIAANSGEIDAEPEGMPELPGNDGARDNVGTRDTRDKSDIATRDSTGSSDLIDQAIAAEMSPQDVLASLDQAQDNVRGPQGSSIEDLMEQLQNREQPPSSPSGGGGGPASSGGGDGSGSQGGGGQSGQGGGGGSDPLGQLLSQLGQQAQQDQQLDPIRDQVDENERGIADILSESDVRGTVRTSEAIPIASPANPL